MPDTVPTHRLTEEASLKMLAAGVAKANALGCKVSLAVVDASCRMIAFLMMDGARHFSIITTQRKAITSASQRMPTGYAPEENALSMSVRMGDFTNIPGGFPIEVAGEVIGAVAAGGAKIEQDVEVAKANALGCKVSLAVVDASCRLIAFLMMDGARHFSIITTKRKAITSASQRMPTGYAPEENALSMAVRMGDFTNVPGGFPIEIGGEVIGAVAAGGAKIEQDVEVAKAALAALTGVRRF